MPDRVCAEIADRLVGVAAASERVRNGRRMSAAEKHDVRIKAERGEIDQILPVTDGDRNKFADQLADMVIRVVRVETGEIPSDPSPTEVTNLFRPKLRRRWGDHLKHPGCGKAISVLYRVNHEMKIERLRQLRHTLERERDQDLVGEDERQGAD